MKATPSMGNHVVLNQEEYDAMLAELSQSKAKIQFLETLVDELPTPVFAKNPQAKFCILNKAYKEFFNVEDDFLGLSVLDLHYLPEDERTKYHREDMDAISNAHVVHYEASYDTVNGETPALYWSKGFYVQGCENQEYERGLVGAIVDLSQQKKLEKELSKTVHKLQQANEISQNILKAAPYGMCVFSDEIELMEVNEAAAELFGYTTAEIFLRKFESLHPEYQIDGRNSIQYIREEIGRAFEYGSNHLEFIGKRSDGELLPLDITSVKVNLDGEDVVVCFLHDLRRIKTMITELSLAKEAAEQSSLVKTAFLENMSHELRTPLNGIVGFLRLLSDTSLDPVQTSYLQKVTLSAHNLLQIIDDVFDVSSLEHGTMEIAHLPFTLKEVFDRMDCLFSKQAAEKGLEFICQTDEMLNTKILGDSVRIKQVLMNLLDNAIKFTEKGTVKLSVDKIVSQEQNIEFEISVQDSGIGLSDEQCKDVFSIFTQGDNSRTRKYGGLGLGLVICKRLLNLMGSDIKLSSIPQKGSKFSFTICFERYFGNSATLQPRNNVNSAKRSGVVLLVEDNKINQLVTQELLKKAGYTIDIANNGQEALDILAKKEFDLILMDIQMPVMDGFTATRNIRQQPEYKEMPIIALSAHAMQSDVAKSLDSGMNEHITKPVSPEILYAVIDKYLLQ